MGLLRHWENSRQQQRGSKSEQEKGGLHVGGIWVGENVWGIPRPWPPGTVEEKVSKINQRFCNQLKAERQENMDYHSRYALMFTPAWCVLGIVDYGYTTFRVYLFLFYMVHWFSVADETNYYKLGDLNNTKLLLKMSRFGTLCQPYAPLISSSLPPTASPRFSESFSVI